ncbi:ABA4-like family protein [Sphingomonas sp. KRR8]|uniref:ABA4-like family protein n=1 Tax=Sphingomonas sp. KRR8 TaxID=2942996 RepID=UPI0020227502|nr:ABA4-like family protein [Sphingomonas sp. KRR8]URD61933.1 ABA4-like family protein [Sphingomonas sp. KRR8]
MSWAGAWTFINLVALLGWAALILLPRRPIVHSLILYAGVGLLCLSYAAIFVLLIGHWADPGQVAGQPPADLSDYSISGIRRLFGSDAGVVMGWTHYLAFDLFVGLWIGRDADNKGFSRVVQAPVLLLTFLAGPLGLALWLLIRERRARRAARA